MKKFRRCLTTHFCDERDSNNTKLVPSIRLNSSNNKSSIPTDAWGFVGILQLDRRQFESSVDSYRKALKVRDRYRVAWNNLRNALRMPGNIDEAEK
jgi:hypothetical protein